MDDRHAARWRGALPLVLAAVVFVLHLPYLWPGGPALRPHGLNLPFEHDEANAIYDAFRILRGELPYRDFFCFKGPVFALLNAGVLAIVPSWAAAQFAWIAVDAVSMGFLARILERISGPFVAVGVVLMQATIIVPIWPRPYDVWLTQAFIVGATAVLIGPRGRTRAGLVAAGLLLGLGVWTVQSMGIPAAIAAVGLVGLRAFAEGAATWRARSLAAVRSAAPLVIGQGFVAAAIVLPLLALGLIGDLYDQAWVWPHRAYVASQLWPYANGETGLLTQIGTIPQAELQWVAKRAVELVKYLPFVLGALTVGWVLRFMGLPRRYAMLSSDRFVVSMMAAASAAHLLYPGINRDITHLAFVGCFGLLALGAVCRPRFLAMSLVAGGILSAALYVYLFVYTWPDARALGSWAEATRAKASFVDRLEALPADATIVYGGFGPGYVYFHVRPGATPLTNFPLRPQIWRNYYSHAQYKWMADVVREKRPAALVLSRDQQAHLRRFIPDLDREYLAMASAGYLLYLRRARH